MSQTWNVEDEKSRLSKTFETFDLAWEFMAFLAKLSRSTGYEPEIRTRGRMVEITIFDDTKNASEYKVGTDAYFDKKEKFVVSETSEDGVALVYTDGGSRGNPGPSASGFVVFNQNKVEVSKGGSYLGITTNNQAEYHSLSEGIKSARDLGFKDVEIYMDSQLVVNQVKGLYKVKNRDLYPLYENAMNILGEFESYKITHIPRELNKLADGMVNEILDSTVGEK